VFAPAQMKKISILVLDRDVRKVTRAMGRMRLVHFETAAEETHAVPPMDQHTVEKELETIANRIGSLQRELEIVEGDFTADGGDGMLAPLLIQRELDVMERQSDRIDAQLREIRSRIKQYESTIKELEGLEVLGIPVEDLPKFSFLHFALGHGASGQVDAIRGAVGNKALVFNIHESEGEERFLAVSDKKGRFALQTAIEKSGAATEEIAEKYKGVAAEILRHSCKELERLRETEESRHATIRGLREKYGPRLAVLDKWVAVERSVLDAGENFFRTSKTCNITGWFPADREEPLLRQLREATEGRMVVEISEPGDEDPPVLLKQNKLLAPFAGLVSTYSTPKYREVEPTVFLAIAFLLMFGLMFGDVGQGAVIAILGIILQKKGKTAVLQQGGMLFLLCGCSSIIFGFLYGSVFGNEELISPLWMAPSHPSETMHFLGLMILFGVGLISLGLFLSVINRLRTGDYYHAILDKTGIVGTCFYWGAVSLGVKAMKGGASTIKRWEIIVLIIVPLVILFFREPIYAIITKRKKLYHEGPLTGIMEALVEIMETVTSFLANTVSFVRVGAFALAHAMLMMAFIQLAEMASGVGYVLILVLGNALAICLEGMIVGIQVLRLNYYEFFGKFFI